VEKTTKKVGLCRNFLRLWEKKSTLAHEGLQEKSQPKKKAEAKNASGDPGKSEKEKVSAL